MAAVTGSETQSTGNTAPLLSAIFKDDIVTLLKYSFNIFAKARSSEKISLFSIKTIMEEVSAFALKKGCYSTPEFPIIHQFLELRVNENQT